MQSTSQAHQRFIIERPRLIQLLDSLEARIILLTAPAGYGKSTLARQWAARRENVLWYEATAASRDVAALVLDLAQACGVTTDGLSEIQSRLSILPAPDDHAAMLAATLSRLLAADARTDTGRTLVVDESDVIHLTPHAAVFLRDFVRSAPLRFLIVGRTRPSWASRRQLLYAEISELDRDTLAFTESETGELLANLPGANTRAMWSRTRGWPAVLRLAVLTQNASLPDEPLGLSLHEYFVEELYELASASLKAQLPWLSVLSNLSSPVMSLVLGGDRSILVDEAIDGGFLVATGPGQFEMHPLLRSFFVARFDVTFDDAAPRDLLFKLLDLREWDNAFSLIRNTASFEHLPQLIARSLDALLAEGRLTTLEDWVLAAHREGIEAPEVSLLEAELSRRAGLLDVARVQALEAADAYRLLGHPWAARAFSLAGICAHLAFYSKDASEHYAKARASAQTNEDARQALWGQFLTHHTHEEDDAVDALHEFETLVGTDPAARVRLATGKFLLACGRGPLEATIRKHLLPLVPLADLVRDPLIRSSFFYQLGYGLSIVGLYKNSAEVVERAFDEVRFQRLTFAQLHFAAARVSVTTGLRKFRRAQSFLSALEELAASVGDAFETSNSRSLQARLALCAGDWQRAADAVKDWSDAPVNALSAELAGLRALALAQAPNTAESERLASHAIRMSRDAQAQTAAHVALAIIDLRAGVDLDHSRIGPLEDVLIARENFDTLVVAYRSYPQLLKVIAERKRLSEHRLSQLITDANDASLATALGMDIARTDTSKGALSRREEEVFALMREGRTNKEIARLLFISEATVKVHVRHILDKLNARSRTEAVVRYQDT